MDVPLWLWGASVAGVIGLITLDMILHVRSPHVPTVGETARWLGFYVSLALVFGVAMGFIWSWGHAGEYFAGYITEESLSFDNMFVFLLIISRFAVPREEQSKVLLIGISIALAFRALLILAGAAAIAAFSWVFFIFGAFLLYTAATLLKGKKEPGEGEESPEPRLVRLVRRMVPTVSEYHGDRLTVVIDGRRHVTPMLLVMVAIGSVDVLFALDSIPAIFGLTTQAYIVFMANAFALMGLRQLYFLLDGMLRRLVYLHVGLAVILGFIGVKLILEALHTNELPFIAGGKPVEWAPEIPIPVSLGIILGTLAIVSIASLIKTRHQNPPE
ncbi:MAG: TerC/Alx family metal homeostasis membrane protein [Bifidobacteriaceae bacterium]|jgi:tellurite resistance protein TerC|nr:TerC/Alx family metal homeostasis membrane protein [Bifidobacteriaceae bacterium]